MWVCVNECRGAEHISLNGVDSGDSLLCLLSFRWHPKKMSYGEDRIEGETQLPKPTHAYASSLFSLIPQIYDEPNILLLFSFISIAINYAYSVLYSAYICVCTNYVVEICLLKSRVLYNIRKSLPLPLCLKSQRYLRALLINFVPCIYIIYWWGSS